MITLINFSRNKFFTSAQAYTESPVRATNCKYSSRIGLISGFFCTLKRSRICITSSGLSMVRRMIVEWQWRVRLSSSRQNKYCFLCGNFRSFVAISLTGFALRGLRRMRRLQGLVVGCDRFVYDFFPSRLRFCIS